MRFNSLGITVALLEKPIVEFLADGFPLVVKLVDVPRPGMGNAHDWP